MSTCYEVATALVDEMSSKLGRVYKLDRKKMAFLKETCDAVERLSEDISCDVLDVPVSGQENDLIFTLVSDDITLDTEELMRNFGGVLPMVDSVRFAKAKYNDKEIVKLRTDIAIHRLWVGADE